MEIGKEKAEGRHLPFKNIMPHLNTKCNPRYSGGEDGEDHDLR
jgi:hypothetical protein